MPHPEIFIEKSTLPKPANFDELFDHPGKMILEIGFGKGKFIRDFATAHPEYRFIGIERFIKWTRFAQERIEKEQLTNIRLLCGLAQDVLQDYFIDHCIDEIHVLFPDPWPKRKHHKHRILQKDYMELFHQKLKKGGSLHITTDHHDYFQYAMKAFSNLDQHLFKVVDKDHAEFKTNYQIKYEKEGRPIYFFQADAC